MTNFCTFSKYISGRKMNKVQRYDNVVLKGHGYDFGQFFLVDLNIYNALIRHF